MFLVKWLVIVGVAIESLCTVCLFVFDERISDAQQSKIIALETRIAPRFISGDMRNRIADKMKPFAGQEYIGLVASDVADAWDLWREISLTLELAGWNTAFSAIPFGIDSTAAATARDGIIAPSPTCSRTQCPAGYRIEWREPWRVFRAEPKRASERVGVNSDCILSEKGPLI
jgi:hypothetical protein